MKKTLYFVSTLIFTVCMLSVNSALAAEIIDSGQFGDNLTWTLDSEGTLFVDGDGEMTARSSQLKEKSDNIRRIIFGDKVTTVGHSAFAQCKNLVYVDFANITRIGDYAFERCPGLTELNLEKVTYIGSMSFQQCKNITSVEFADNAFISFKAFLECKNLAVADLTNVSTIYDHAFQGCSKLTAVNLTNVSSIGVMAFNRCESLTTVFIPKCVTSIGYAPFASCVSLTEIIVDKDNPNYCSVDGVLFDKEKTTVIQYPANKNLSFYNVPDTVSTIGYSAFAACKHLTDINLSNVSLINTHAFEDCFGITFFDLSRVSVIKNDAFSSCISLISANLDNVEYIGHQAFFNCRKLEKLDLPNIHTIEYGAFSMCENLQKLTIYPKDTNISYEIFSARHKDLTIYGYAGSTAEAHAKNNNIPFVVLDSTLPVPPTDIDVILPTFDITINGGKIENADAKYPCVLYNNITYFPMTYSGARSLGLTSDWTSAAGLVIEKNGTEPTVCEFEQNSVSNSSVDTAAIATGKITVNGKVIDNSREEYPLLVFRDITYFPLTWRFAVEEFGWDYSFTPETGLMISCK